MKDKNQSCRLGTVGGQAVIEGVMMRHADDYAVAVRMPQGNIKITTEKFVSVRKKHKMLDLPLIRGVVNFIESMQLSFRTLNTSVEAFGIEEEETKFEKWLREKFGKGILDFVMGIAMVLGLALGFGLFFLLPTFLTKLLGSVSGTDLGWFRNLIEGLIKIGIFIAYIALVSLMPDIRRTFEYHGAEHKSIFCYESGKELTAENAAQFKRFHPRCGTSFIFVMLALSILIYSLPFIPWNNIWLRLLIKLPLLPVIVGLGYEFLRYAGRHDNLLTKILSAPGLWMQRLTTREPDEKQLEVAIAALKCSLPDEFPEDSAALLAAAEAADTGNADGMTENHDENTGTDDKA